MKHFYLFKKEISILKKGFQLLLCSMIWLFNPGALSACDTSGFQIDAFTDNGDGTFTIDMTILVAGDLSTDCGSTWGFWWMIDAPIISLAPADLTSANGTTLTGIITGSTITWGDPLGTWPTIPFVDAEAGSLTPDENFQVSIIVGSLPSEWNGGGQEANTCPGGGCGANPTNYQGFPCLTPFIVANPVAPSCPGAPIEISVNAIPPYLTEEVVWQPGGLVGTSVIVSPTETTEYTATASNNCEEFSVTVLVEVIPFPEIEAIEEDITECEGFPVVLEVVPQNELTVTWDPPSGGIGNVQIVSPSASPTIYNATASNQCGEANVMIVVNTIPPPTVEITNDPEVVCGGEPVDLESEATDADIVEWLPGNLTGENVTVNPDSTTTYIVVASSSCGVGFDSILVSVASTDTIQVDLETCDGESVTYNGIPLAAGTSSTFTFGNLAGCDSVVNVSVAALPTFAVPVELEACEGTTVTYEGQQLSPGDMEEFMFTAINGCDSVVTVTVLELENYASSLALEACANETVTYETEQLSPGDEMDFTFTALNGCDSIVTVTVSGFPTFDETVMLQTCTGTTIPYLGQDLAPGSTTTFDLLTINGCDSTVTVSVEELTNFTTAITLEACTGTTVTYNGDELMPGSVTDFPFVSLLGCDSIVTVTVNEVAIIQESVNLEACSGESVAFDGQMLLAGTTMDFNYVTSQGCDSVVTVTVDELSTFALPLTLEACVGSSIMYNGEELFAGTTTDVTLTATNGCDSVMTVTVDELMDVTAALSLGACTGETVTFQGQELAPGDVMDFNFISSLGCDSVLTVTVEEYPTYGYPLILQACTGSTITFDGVPLPPNTSVDFTYQTINGCDSIVAVTVEEVETIFNELEFETCEGTVIIYEGQQLPPGSETDFPFTSVNGCDSIVTVTVELSDELIGAEEFDACVGTTVTYNGQELDPGTVTDIPFVTAAGCDSIVTVTVNSFPTFAFPVDLQACTGSTAEFDGQQLDPNTVTDFDYLTIDGCDSIITVTVAEVDVLTGTELLAACPGETVFYAGEPLVAGDMADFTFTSTLGCDSIVTVTVEPLAPTTGPDQIFNACAGESITYNGEVFEAGTTNEVTLTGSNGCDSVLFVIVNELTATIGSVTLQECEGETITFNGTVIDPGTSMDFTFVNSAGCDSIITVTALDPIPFVESSDTIEVCEGESAIIFGQVVSSAGTYSETFTGSNGCDSIHRVTLNIANELLLEFADSLVVGLGEAIVLEPLVPLGANLSYLWDEDPTLSCWDCPNPEASPQTPTTYYLTVVNDQGCAASNNVLVSVRKSRDIYIPNSFSPNGDGANERFLIYSDPSTVEMVSAFRVFSRWGESVFVAEEFPTNDPTFGWDGTFRGKRLDPGVFVYMAEIVFIDGFKQLYKGEVILMK
ncbi:MAG: gliding motility-associated C-terminal domain-containing protein [Bacteroidota bacterium]